MATPKNEKRDNLTRKGLKNLENIAKDESSPQTTEQKEWHETIKPKIKKYLAENGYKPDKIHSESEWLGILGLELGFNKEKAITSGNFTHDELKKIDDYRSKVEGDIFRRTTFSPAGTISQDDGTSTPDREVRRRIQERFDQLDNILGMWDMVAGLGGGLIGATGFVRERNRVRIRDYKPGIPYEPTEKSLYIPREGNTRPELEPDKNYAIPRGDAKKTIKDEKNTTLFIPTQEFTPKLPDAQAERLPTTKKPGSDTEPPFPTFIRQYLGEDIAKKAGQIGMDEKDVQDYLAYLQLLGKVNRWSEGKVAEVSREEINKTFGTLGDNLSLAREITSYGYNPKDIAMCLDTMTAKGNNKHEIINALTHEMKLAGLLKNEFCNGDIKKAQSAISGSDGDLRAAIEGKKWNQLLAEWNAKNPLKEPGRARLEKFSDEAEVYRKNLELNDNPDQIKLMKEINASKTGEKKSQKLKKEREIPIIREKMNPWNKKEKEMKDKGKKEREI